MSYASDVLADAPLGYWRLGEASGTTAADSSGNARSGTWSTAVAPAGSLLVGDTDGAADWNQQARQVTVANGSWMNVGGAFTLEAIIQPRVLSSAGPRTILDRDNETQRIFQFRLTTANKLELILWTSSGGPFFADGATTIPTGTPTHVAAVYDGAHVTLYVNGVADASVAITGTISTAALPLLFGAHAGGSYWDGLMDEVAVYGTALSATRVAAHANTAKNVGSVSGSTVSAKPALAVASAPTARGWVPTAYSLAVTSDAPAWYARLGEASGTTFLDQAGNGTTGTWDLGLPDPVAGLLTGDTDGARSFTGDDGGTVPYGTWMATSTALTLEAWIKTTSGGAILDRDVLTTGRVWQFRVSSGKLQFITIGGSTGTVTATSVASVNDGVRHHVAATFDGSNIRLYIDGVLDNTVAASGSLLASLVPLRIGVSNSGGSSSNINQFVGTIDEPAYYTSVLSGTRIAAHYTTGSTAPASPATVVAPVAAATAQALAPTVTGATSIPATVVAPQADATAQALAPTTVTGAGTVVAPVVTATAQAPAPAVTGATSIPGTVVAPAATATAQALAPTVTGPAVIYDDFSGSALDPAWSSAGTIVGPTMDHPGVTAQFAASSAILRDCPAGDHWGIEVKFASSTSGSMVGPMIVNDAGTGVGACVYTAPVGLLICGISAYGYSGTYTNADDTDTSRVTRIRLLNRGGHFYAQHSEDDGATWSAENLIPYNASFTPTKVGWGDWLGGSTVEITEFKEIALPSKGYAGVIFDASPTAYYRLGEASGNAIDSSGNGHDQTMLGSPLRGGPSLVNDTNASTDFNGAARCFSAGAWSAFTNFSVEAVIRPSNVSGDNIIISRTSFAWAPSDTSSRGWHFIIKDGHLDLGLTMTDGTYLEGGETTLLTNGAVYHVVATWDGTDAKVYINGELDFTYSALAGKTLNNVVGQAVSISGENGFGTLANFKGLIDEVAVFDRALTATEVADHRTAMMPHPITVPVGQATETDDALAVGVVITSGPMTIALPMAVETDDALVVDVTIAQPLVIPVGIASETDAALPVTVLAPLVIPVGIASSSCEALDIVMDDGTEPTVVFLGKAVESEEALELDALVQVVASISFSEETEVALPLSPCINAGHGFQLGVAIEQEQARAMIRPVIGPSVAGVLQTVVWSGPSGVTASATALILDILEHNLLQAPTSVLVSVVGFLPMRMLNFSIDGVLVSTEMGPDGSGFALFSVPVPEAQGRRGEHILTVSQTGAASAQAIFELREDPDLLPTDRGPDTAPVEIPASIHPSGVRRWVLQDLMPGGLGSYVMPLNPTEMDNPSYERVLSTRHTTAVNEGTVHVSEGAVRPLEWSFKGYCPTEEMAETLRAYAELKRRFYIHDHRGRAWIVVVTGAEIVPRLQQRNIYGDLTDWVHDYTISAVIFDRAEFS